MADQQALDATFFAFKKRDGTVLLPASVAFSIATIVFFVALGVVVFYMLGGTHFVDWYRDTMNVAIKGGVPQPPPNMGAIFLIFPIEMIALFFFFVLLASFESSSLRWMIRDERSGPLNLHFGADMWRVYGTYWFWFLYFICTTIAFCVVMFVLGLVAGAIGGKDNPMIAGALVALGFIAWALIWIYVTVRLAPAAATSVGAGHFAPMKAWSVSNGRFWALFGSFLLLMVIYVIAVTVVAAIAMGPFYASIFNSVDWSKLQTDATGFSSSYQEASMEALQKMLSNPVNIALYFGGQIVMWAVALAFYILYYGVNARAVRVGLEDGKLAHEPPSD